MPKLEGDRIGVTELIIEHYFIIIKSDEHAVTALEKQYQHFTFDN